MTPKRKPAKKRATKPDFIFGSLRETVALAREQNRPITRAFLIRLAAITCSIVVSDKQGLSADVYLDRFTDLIEKAVR